MTRTLMILRHAKSSWKDKSLRDFDRPLKKKGQQTAKLIGKIIRHADCAPDIILSSPAERAKETTAMVALHSHYNGPVEYVESLYMGEPGDYIRALQELPVEIKSAMVVGHNPGLEALLQLLEGKVNALSTGALAVLNLELTDWQDLNSSTVGKLSQFWDPDEIDLEEIEEEMAKEKKEKEKKDKKDKKDKKKDKK
ncbi:MAG: histidine phosphatase family protein [Chloroflexi bacterium]|nr:histidine phosphatase family protein [Chloroflexota bacterium]